MLHPFYFSHRKEEETEPWNATKLVVHKQNSFVYWYLRVRRLAGRWIFWIRKKRTQLLSFTNQVYKGVKPPFRPLCKPWKKPPHYVCAMDNNMTFSGKFFFFFFLGVMLALFCVRVCERDRNVFDGSMIIIIKEHLWKKLRYQEQKNHRQEI